MNCISQEFFQRIFKKFSKTFSKGLSEGLSKGLLRGEGTFICALENNIQSVSRCVFNDVEIFKTSSFTEVICCKTGKKMLTLKPTKKIMIYK